MLIQEEALILNFVLIGTLIQRGQIFAQGEELIQVIPQSSKLRVFFFDLDCSKKKVHLIMLLEKI